MWRHSAGRGLVGSIVSGLSHLSGWVAYALIGALVFGETAVFLGFVLPGETAVVIGGVLASRGHLSLAMLSAVVVVAAVAGPIVGYEIGSRMGDRVFGERAPRLLRRMPGGPQRARDALRDRGAMAILLGRFVAFVRAVMPAAAGAVRVPYRTFLVYNVVGAVVWGVGYCLLGYLAGSAYSAVESRVGTGLAVGVAVVVLVAVAVWVVRRHRRAAASRPVPDSGPSGSDDAGAVGEGGSSGPEGAGAGLGGGLSGSNGAGPDSGRTEPDGRRTEPGGGSPEPGSRPADQRRE
jgi:membrane-associated protein